MSQPAPGGCKPFLLQWWAVILFACILLSLFLTITGLRPGRIVNELNGIVAISPHDVWAVGYSTTLTGSVPLVEHYNGRWNLVASPGKDTDSILESVAASSSHDVWAVGESYQSYSSETLIEHWDGASWQIVPSPNGPGANSLSSVAVVSPTDAWAVGSADPCPPLPADAVPIQRGNALARERPLEPAAECTGEQPLIEHWDGHTWSIVKSPNPLPHPQSKNPSASLSTVVALSAQEVWASGTYSDPGITPADGAALVEQWDGMAWHIRTDFDTAIGGNMWGTAFLSSSDMWGAEYATNPSEQPTLKHWNGDAWSVVAGPEYGAGGYFVGAMAGSRSDDLWAVGNREPPGQDGDRGEVFAMHWNGRDWSLVPTPTPGGRYIQINGSTSLSARDAWMMGHFDAWNDDQYSFIEHWDGQDWSIVPSQNPGLPWGIFHSGNP